MRKISMLGTLCMIFPAVAMAHDTGAPHLHPHGIGVVFAGLAIVAVGVFLYKEQAGELAQVKRQDKQD